MLKKSFQLPKKTKKQRKRGVVQQDIVFFLFNKAANLQSNFRLTKV